MGIAVACVAAAGFAQGWSEAYQKALDSAKAERWNEARTFFRQAASLRAEDFSGPTSLRKTGQTTETWRNGASYSPNFGAAYAGYRFSLKISDDTERTAMLRKIAGEFETLITKNQLSAETFYFLNNTYSLLRDGSAQQKLEARRKSVPKLEWLVDSEILTADDRAAVSGQPTVAVATRVEKPPVKQKTSDTAKPTEPTKPVKQPVKSDTTTKPVESDKPAKNEPEKTVQGNPTEDPGTNKPKKQDPPKEEPKKEEPKKDEPKKKERPPVYNPTEDIPVKPIERPADPNKPVKKDQGFVRAGAISPDSLGPVVQISNKYALIIGNSTSGMPDASVAFGGSDSDIIKTGLVTYGGYPEENVAVVKDATASQILERAKELASRVGEDGVVFIYFTGVGAHLDGKDYLAGVDTQMSTDSSTMLAKTDLYQVFMSRGARIFAFFQANRPIIGGKAFGDEVPMVGAIAQMQATMRGGVINSMVREGQPVGLFTFAISQTLNELRSNTIPVLEFAWQVFDRIRRGTSGTSGGAATQVPTLPVLTNLAQDARF